jgi:hypothetical protein
MDFSGQLGIAGGKEIVGCHDCSLHSERTLWGGTWEMTMDYEATGKNKNFTGIDWISIIQGFDINNKNCVDRIWCQ